MVISVGGLTPEDRPVWTELFRGYNTFYERDLPAPMYDRAWREFQAGTRMHALGGRLDGQLVGIAHFFAHPSTTAADSCYLQDLFTAAEARGRGVACALIAAVGQWARGQDCARLYWHTQAGNQAARRLYDQVGEHKGFIVYQVAL